MSHANAAIRAPLDISITRLGSGTSWLPDSSASRGVHRSVGDWMLMLHGVAFIQYDQQETIRGDRQLGFTDWEMVSAEHPAGGGLLHLRAMTSFEALGLGGRGYPLVLQTGESYRGSMLHDRQHPHDLFMELAGQYEHDITQRIAASVYAGAVGEPALGPAAFMHRPSAESDPLAPLGHHWQDASHESFGVVTAGIFTHRVNLEGSVFNAREPDAYRFNLDYRGARLDSYAGRLSFAASPRVTASAWWGFLNDHDRLEPGSEMHRYGASLMTEHAGIAGGTWSNTFIIGRNVHHHTGPDHAAAHGDPSASPHHRSTSLLAESNLEIGPRNAVFARVERVEKSGEELGFLGGDLTQLFLVQSISGGYLRTIASGRGAELGLGARGAVAYLPPTLQLAYQTRTPTGFAVYARIRPVRSRP